MDRQPLVDLPRPHAGQCYARGHPLLLRDACGIGISQFCLLFTHHILGFTSAVADNIAVYVVGFALGTAFRFLFYHYVVFTGHTRA